MTTAHPKTITVCQGELAVSDDRNVILSAVLGSCVATCLWDPGTRVGGMNHILLPGSRKSLSGHNKFGVYAMEALINELMKIGGCKSALVAKIFGGAATLDEVGQIGVGNAIFVRDFLKAEGIPILAESIGGRQARRLKFFPENGRAKMQITADPVANEAPNHRVVHLINTKVATPGGGAGEVELF